MMTEEFLASAFFGNQPRFVYQFGCGVGTGFCADMTWMMTQLVKCLQFGIGFSLGKVTRPTNFCIAKGWEDYFLPFCEEVAAPGLQRFNSRAIGYSRRVAPIRPLIRSWLRATSRPPARYFMFDELGDLDCLSPPFFEESQPFFMACAELLSIIWRYNESTAADVAQWKAHAHSPPSVALIIRRGDKNSEHSYVPIGRYLQTLDRLPHPLGGVFVASDDDRICSEISSAAPSLAVLTLPGLGLHGYEHRSFSSLSVAQKMSNMTRFFAQIELCRNASLCIGSPTTNVTTFVRMLRGDRSMLLI